MPEWRKICCAVDFSDASRFAMEAAAELAASSGGELTLVHVVGARPRYAAGLPHRAGSASPDTADVGRRLDAWREAAKAIAKTDVSASLLTGAAADQILAFAREAGCDLLVLGTPGALGCERIEFGSVAEGVIRRAPCTVVVARRRASAARS